MTEPGWRRAILGVAVASALLCLPLLGAFPLFDPDEGYYPAAAAESLAHGHPLDLTLNGEPRWEKPPLAYALMQASFLLLGKTEFAARLPSVLEGAALVAILGLLVARVAGGRAGLLSAVVLASSLGHQIMTRAAHPEMGLVLGTAAAQLLFALWFVSRPGERSAWAWWAAGIAMGFGFLAKGPVALAMPALMLLAGMLLIPKEGRPSWGEAGRAFGFASLLGLALAAPWFLWMGARHPEFWGKVLGLLADYAEKEPGGFRASPFFFVPVLAGAFLPWILFLPGALRGLRRSDPSPAARFAVLMALAAGTSFLFWSASSAKNPHYALAFLPPLAAVVGAWSDRGPGRAGSPWQIAGFAALVSGIFAAITPAVPFALAKSIPPAWVFAHRILEEEGDAKAAVAVYRRRLPSVSFYTGREVAWPHTPEALEEFVFGPGTRFLVIHGRHMDLLRKHPHREVDFDPDTDYFLVRLDPPSSPAPPAPALAPPAGGPR